MPPKTAPSSFGRYQVLGELGSGSMGIVYLGMDTRLGRPVAIKVMRAADALTDAASADFAARFRREAEAVGRLSHPNIVQIYDIGPSYLVMEYVEGDTLLKVSKRGRPLSMRHVTTVVGCVAEALDFAHRHGIVHRDVKPANVMIASDGAVKVMDFGVARLEDSKLTAAGSMVGSVQYMAPEQMLGSTIDGRADVFSLASVTYELITGRAPFPGKTITEVVSLVVQGAYVPPRNIDERLPESINRVFAGALARDPEKRYQRAASFAQDLQAALHPIFHLNAVTVGAESPSGGEPASARSEAPVEGTLVLDPKHLASIADEARREGMLVIDSDPSGARTFVDGYDVGETPIAKVETRLGAHVLTFEREGRQRTSVSAELTKAKPMRIVTVSLPREAPSGVFPGKLTEWGSGVVPPVRIQGSAPAYPEAAARRGIEGTCVVEFWVDESGEPKDVAVIESAGQLLDKAFVGAVMAWRFSPARLHGIPVSMRLTAQHAFRA